MEILYDDSSGWKVITIIVVVIYYYSRVKKSKAVPLHAMEAPGGRGGIAPTHSWPRH
jgi:hypothetical protein